MSSTSWLRADRGPGREYLVDLDLPALVQVRDDVVGHGVVVRVEDRSMVVVRICLVVVCAGTLTHHWFGVVDDPVELLAIFGPQGERVHVRR